MVNIQSGIKISPNSISIKDAKKGSCVDVDITLQNYSKNSKVIRLRGPETEHFVLKAPSEEQLVASGLVINAKLRFDCQEERHYEDKIIVFVDNKPVVVPIKVFAPSPKLEFESPVSFGISIPDGLVLTRYVDIKNNGKQAGNFRIDYAGDQPIKIFPCVGTIEPGSARSIKIEFTSSDLGAWEEIAGVELEGTGYTELRMYGEVRSSSLMLLNISGTSHLQLINFGATLFECEKFQPAVLYNNGPTSLGFVIILEEGGVGQELKSSDDKALPRSISNCITASPNQGGIGPYEKVVINFCFAPALSHLQSERSLLANQEFVLFMHIVPVTTVPAGRMLIDSEYIKQNKLTPLVEIGVTGRPVEVDVTITPNIQHNLGTCEVGKRTNTMITLTNSNTLPLQFSFSRIAHFAISPAEGKMGPGEKVDVEITFCPSQFGSFSKRVQLDILGIGNFITDTTPDPEPKIIAQGKLKVLKQIDIQVKGVCQVSNLNKHQKLEEICAGVRKQTKFDLYSSIRPSNDRSHSLTTFTKQERYSYVDTDYAYTEEEKLEREEHKDRYKSYIDNLRNTRLAKIKSSTATKPRKMEEFNTSRDIGMQPSGGLLPPKVKDSDAKKQPHLPRQEGLTEKVMTSVELASRQASLRNTIMTTTNVPTTPQEKRECNTRLTPQQMHQIVIGPALIDFGEVSLRTVNTKPLMIVNHLDIHVFIQLDIDCREMRQTLPLSQVIPPHTMSKVDITFESLKSGTFQRSVVYTVNNHIKQHINVHARIVTPEIALSTSEITLRPTVGVPHTYGYSGIVKLTNVTNGPADFTWRPDKISPFAVRPSQGTVEPHSSLNCEVLYFPSVSSPLDAEFTLDVVEGNTTKLKCLAEFASPSVKFVERRLSVGVLPLHVVHKVTAGLKNTGYHHAFFQVINSQPTSFCSVKPDSGCIPVGGMVNLELSFFAVEIEKFDFKIDVKIRKGKRQTLRVGGSVEPPLVECDLDTFAFSGVHVGSTMSHNFHLVNPMASEAEVVYNLSKYRDFKLEIPHRNFADDSRKNYVEDNYYHVYMSPSEKVNLKLVFSPQQVASYDFNLPVLINDMLAPPPPTRKISTAGSRTSNPDQSLVMSTPCRRVTATAMFPVLSVDNLQLSFAASPFTAALRTVNSADVQGFKVTNVGEREVSFSLDIREFSTIFEEGVFRFINEKQVPTLPALIDIGSVTWKSLKPGESTYIGIQFNPNSDCSYSFSLPLMLDEVTRYPYRTLQIEAKLEPPKLDFSTANIMLLPTPLRANITTSLEVTATNYTCPIEVDVELSEIRSDEGDVITPITLSPDKISLPPCSADCPSRTIPIEISYYAEKSTTFRGEIIFKDPHGNTYKVGIVGTSENCLLTNYPFVNSNPRFHLLSGETEYTQQYTPPTATPSTVSLISGGQQCESAPIYTPLSILSLRDGARNAFRAYITPLKTQNKDREETGEMEQVKEEEGFLLQVLNSAERWISQMGWSNLPNPVSIPHTICQTVLLKKGTVTDDGGKRKSVFELIQNLCGRAIPGIPVNPPIPANAQERVKLLHWQLNTMLTFLRVQGAKLTHVRAEWFLSAEDFLLWSHLSNFEGGLPAEAEEDLLMKHAKFSSQAWVDLVLQLAKVFVLVKVKPTRSIQINTESYKTLARSVYSTEERTLLAWLSHHYESQRRLIWPENPPQTRWIVSFDNDLLDGLVLATLLASYCPFLVRMHFHDMYLNVRSPEECFHNALAIVQALRTIGIDYDIHPTDIMQPSPISMLLFITHLYITLPQYRPKTTVLFDGVLHQPVVKELKIENPSNKPIFYSVSIVGEDSSSFSVQPASLSIGPHSSAMVKVRFSSCWLHPCSTALMLVSRRTGSACGNTLLFNLHSAVNDIFPVSTVRVESAVYKTHTFPLTVTNPLSGGGTFKIVLVESKGFKDGLKERKKTQHSTSASNTTIGTYDPTKVSVPSNSPSAFWCNETVIDLGGRGTATLQMEFLPLTPGLRNCALLFSCQGVGEFLQSVEGMGLYPEPLSISHPPNIRLNSPVDKLRQEILGSGSCTVIRYRCDPDKELEEVLDIPLQNPQKMEALIETAKHRMSDIEIRRRKLTGTLASASLACLEPITGGEEPDCSFYTVHSNSKHFTFPDAIQIDANAGAKLPFQFKADGQGFYPAKVVLVNPGDIRVYELEVTCTPSTTQAEIVFNAPTLQSVIQEIPIINETQHDWNLSAVIEGEAYYGPPTILAKSSATTLYPLMFKPTYQGEIEGELILTNVANGTVHKFKLSGTGLKPLPQETVTLRCHARQRSSHTVHVHNPSEKRKTFQAFTDMDCIVGLHEVVIEGGISVPYEITAYPIKQGTYKGVFSFETVKPSHADRESVCSNGAESHSVWYSIEVIADPPPPEKTIDLFCEAKKAISLELSICNPTDKEVLFEVSCTGEGISGPDSVSVGPKTEASYELLYKPTFIGKTQGSVVFLSKELGEFWYELRLNAEKPRAVPLPDVVAELGKTATTHIPIRNDLSESCLVHITLSNPAHFVLHSQRKVSVAANSSVDVDVTFIPSSLGMSDNQCCLLEFSSVQLGEWSYTLQGQGLLPTVMDPILVSCALGEVTQTLLPFKNPLNHAITVTCRLLQINQIQDKEKLFSLLVGEEHITLQSKAMLELPFTFRPFNMTQACAHIVVEVVGAPEASLEGMKWQFPIKGSPVYNVSKGYELPLITCKAKERKECFLELLLDVEADSPAKTIPYREAQLKDAPCELPAGWKREQCDEEFSFSLDDNSLLTAQHCSTSLISPPGLRLITYTLVFAPGKPLKKTVRLTLKSKAGGMWEFPLQLHSLEADPDDTLIIRATGLHKDSVVGMRLNALDNASVAYEAYLEQGSDPDFRVYPESGHLLPLGTEGSLICVAYRPTIYGKVHNAKLIIQTAENQWSYSIQGQSPSFRPPVGVTTTPHHAPPARTTTNRKNFIRQNMRNLAAQKAVQTP